MRSIFSRIWSALRFGSTVNGSMGTCKKRERFFMRGNSTSKSSGLIRREARHGRTARDVLQKAQIGGGSKLNAVQLGLRQRKICFVPQADVRHQFGKPLLDSGVP